MKEEINLLPPVAKNARLRRLYGARWNSLYWAVAGSCLLMALVYAGIVYTHWTTDKELLAEVSPLSGSDQGISKQVTDINRLLVVAEKQARTNQPWTNHLQDIMLAAPPGVVLTSIKLRPANDKAGENPVLVISGTTASRPSVVDYERKLKSLAWVKQLEAPLTNLASGPEVTFTFTLIRQEQAPL